tara:strand:- start:91 stop:900 length:810 start_codon:yes stop_codon:yes gene_type:complete
MHTPSHIVFTAMGLLATIVGPSGAQPAWSPDEMAHFLRTAEVVESDRSTNGSTSPWRLRLSDGTVTHQAAYQSIDRTLSNVRFPSGRTELTFVDSYHYNIAAYELARLLGLGDMVPVTVERRWNGERGSASWWVDAEWDDAERRALGLKPPDARRWNRQMYKMLVFTALVQDTDRNRTNTLISKDWHVWMIDFSRAFRLEPELPDLEALRRCDPGLLARLRALDRDGISAAVGSHLSALEIDAVLERRDRLVAHFDALVAEQGAARVLR